MTPWAFLCNVIQSEMGLIPGQVYVYENRFKIPPDSALYIAVGVQDRRCVANTNRPTPADGGVMTQEQYSAWWALLLVNVMSKDEAARDRLEEVVMALKSIRMQQGSELNGFRFGELPKSIPNLAEIDGSAIPYRFAISLAVNYGIAKSTPIDSYNTFGPVVVTTEP